LNNQTPDSEGSTAVVDRIIDDPDKALAADTHPEHDSGQHTQYVRYAGTDAQGREEFEVSMLGSRFPNEGQRIVDTYSEHIVRDWVDQNDVEVVDQSETEGFDRVMA
jgi:hypothetical protein